MSDFKAIGDVGRTLGAIIGDDSNWAGITKPEVTFLSPKQIKDKNIATPNTVSVFLYHISRNPLAVRMEEGLGETGYRHPPLALDLSYLVTVYNEDPTHEKYVLGKVMQVLHDHPVIDGSAFMGSLAGLYEEIKVVLDPATAEDMARIWNAFQDVGYRPSLSYTVTPVRIDSGLEAGIARVVSKETGYMHMARNMEGRK